MKYSIFYKRKIQIQPYEMLELGMSTEFDSASTPVETGFDQVKNQVDKWVEEEWLRLREEGEKREGG